MNDDTLNFENEPLSPSSTTVTSAILSKESVLKGDNTEGEHQPQRSVLEGQITLDPRGRIFFIPPLDSTVNELSPDRSKWDLYLVYLPFTLHPAPGKAYYEELTFFVDLATPDAVAYDLFPDSITSEIEETKTYTLSPQITFREAGISLGQISRQLQFKGLHPTITAFGKNEHNFYWIHQGFKEQKAVIPESKHAAVILQVPRGTSFVEGHISYSVKIVKKMMGSFKKRDGRVNAYPIRWDLQDAPSLFRVDAGQGKKTEMLREPSLFDVCIFCVLAKEAAICMKLIEQQCGVSFQPGFSPNTGRYYHTAIQNIREEQLTIHISWQLRPGSLEAVMHIRPVLEEFKPCFVAMTGICAGERRIMKLGDLVVAGGAFTYDARKIMMEKEEKTQLLQDIDMWLPSQDVLQFARMFQQWKPAIANIEHPSSQFHPQPELYIAPMASGNAVRGDNPFKEIHMLVRNAVAIDMEAAAFYRTVAEFPGVRSLLVKGIADYADGEKNDSYYEYASAVSAMYMLSFVREYVTSDRIARLRTEAQ